MLGRENLRWLHSWISLLSHNKTDGFPLPCLFQGVDLTISTAQVFRPTSPPLHTRRGAGSSGKHESLPDGSMFSAHLGLGGLFVGRYLG